MFVHRSRVLAAVSAAGVLVLSVAPAAHAYTPAQVNTSVASPVYQPLPVQTLPPPDVVACNLDPQGTPPAGSVILNYLGIPKSTYAPGEHVTFTIELANNSGVCARNLEFWWLDADGAAPQGWSLVSMYSNAGFSCFYNITNVLGTAVSCSGDVPAHGVAYVTLTLSAPPTPSTYSLISLYVDPHNFLGQAYNNCCLKPGVIVS